MDEVLSSEFTNASEIQRLGDSWVRSPVERLRALKNASKQIYTVRRNFAEVAAKPEFKAAEATMERVCNSLLTALKPLGTPFARNFEVNWKMATLLSRLCHYEDALMFAERAQDLLPRGDNYKRNNVHNKMAGILIELEKIHPGNGHGERAVTLSRELAIRSSDDQNLRLLGRALVSVRRSREAEGIFAGYLSPFTI